MARKVWKVSMGPGGSGREFKNLLKVLDFVHRGLVLVHKNTKAIAGATAAQGDLFTDKERDGDYFYLCHGNERPSVLLFGQFIGPANVISDFGHGWAERKFNWIKTATLNRKYRGTKHWWTPNGRTTFAEVPEDSFKSFEKLILRPYFAATLKQFGLA